MASAPACHQLAAVSLIGRGFEPVHVPMIWSKLAFAAAASQAEPSWNVTPVRRLNVISYAVDGLATTAA